MTHAFSCSPLLLPRRGLLCFIDTPRVVTPPIFPPMVHARGGGGGGEGGMRLDRRQRHDCFKKTKQHEFLVKVVTDERVQWKGITAEEEREGLR